MRTIRTKVYQFSELSEQAKQTAIIEQAKFEIEIMDEGSIFYPAAVEMDKMQTPWFLLETLVHDYRDELIEAIEINEYHFTQDGKMFNK